MLERIAAGRTDLVLDWVARGGAPDISVEGATLLEWCAYYGDVTALRSLLQQGVKLERLGDNFGLSGAAFHRHWRLCEFLLEHGADPNFADPANGETPLHAALCHHGNAAQEQVVRVLLDWKADPNKATRAGAVTDGFMRDARTRAETPLHRAAAFGAAETIELLIEAGAKTDLRDAAGDSPLSWASWALRDTSVLRLLSFADFRINPARQSMERYLVGRPVSGGETRS